MNRDRYKQIHSRCCAAHRAVLCQTLTCACMKEGLVTFERFLGYAESACLENRQANQITGLQFVMWLQCNLCNVSTEFWKGTPVQWSHDNTTSLINRLLEPRNCLKLPDPLLGRCTCEGLGGRLKSRCSMFSHAPHGPQSWILCARSSHEGHAHIRSTDWLLC